jgi:hypothetical protein
MNKTEIGIRANSRYDQGQFRPRNPQKYKGNPSQIIYRSSWEKKLMNFLDMNSGVVRWSSEEFFIPYRSPKDGKIHRYFVDFWAEMRTVKGTEQFIMEVKPLAQTMPPPRAKRVTKAYLERIVTYNVNMAKFEAAKAYCDQRKMKFMVLTEKQLGI